MRVTPLSRAHSRVSHHPASSSSASHKRTACARTDIARVGFACAYENNEIFPVSPPRVVACIACVDRGIHGNWGRRKNPETPCESRRERCECARASSRRVALYVPCGERWRRREGRKRFRWRITRWTLFACEGVGGLAQARHGSIVTPDPVAKPYPNPTLSVLNVILVDGARPAPVLQRHRASRRRSSHARVASYFYFHPRASPKSSWLAWMRASMVRAAGDVAQKTDG